MTLTRPALPRHRNESLKTDFLTKKQITVVLLLFTSTLCLFYILQAQRPSGGQQRNKGTSALEASTLVIYVFRSTDPESLNNFFYFLDHGLREDGARYIISLDPTLPEAELPSLPELPPNAEYIRPPTCFEMGVAGWLLYTSGRVAISDYRYFVWVSSSVRGPFLPSYVQDPWHVLLTKKLAADVKLVGCTISCSVLIIDTAQAPLQQPHVQNYVMATDRVGLGLLKKVGALDCHNNWMDNVRFAEFGASAAILNARYNLDSLMLRYQGVNWRDPSNWSCNARLDPLMQNAYDGTSLNALEVMFLHTDFASLVVDQPAVSQAVLYSEWADFQRAPHQHNISSNGWLRSAARKQEEVMARPPACFDSEYYIMASPVEFKDYSPEQAYEHFKTTGFREGRPYMFIC